MSTPAISQRSVVNGEPQWGQGQGNFVTGIEAVATLIQTRLQLFLGEWFLNLSDGLPLWNILGQSNDSATTNAIIQARIQGTPYVTGVSDVAWSFSQSTGQFSYSAQVATVFGPISISGNVIAPPSS
jgi:hypothetical protein